jgi:hypothetical protein
VLPLTARGLLLATLLLVLGTLVVPAGAATRTVHLTANGPSPAKLSLKSGDRVQFVNDDSVPHQVTSQGSWQYDSGPIAPGSTSPQTPALTAPGTYRYADGRGIVVFPQTFTGSLVVPRPTASPTASPRPTATPTPRPTASPRPTGTPTPSATSSATPSPTPTAGPTGTASPSPAPAVTSPPPGAAPDPRYGDPRALVQGSPHRYGLPVLLGLVGIGGVASLLGRYLLGLAPRRD